MCNIFVLTALFRKRYSYNKSIGDDTKAVARQSLNCVIKKNKKKSNMAKNDFLYGG